MGPRTRGMQGPSWFGRGRVLVAVTPRPLRQGVPMGRSVLSCHAAGHGDVTVAGVPAETSPRHTHGSPTKGGISPGFRLSPCWRRFAGGCRGAFGVAEAISAPQMSPQSLPGVQGGDLPAGARARARVCACARVCSRSRALLLAARRHQPPGAAQMAVPGCEHFGPISSPDPPQRAAGPPEPPVKSPKASLGSGGGAGGAAWGAPQEDPCAPPLIAAHPLLAAAAIRFIFSREA